MSEQSPLTLSRAIEIIEDAFQPHECRAAYRPLTHKLAFRVVLSGDRVFEGNQMDRHEFEDRDEFERIVENCRLLVQGQDDEPLHPWTMPSE